MASHPDVTEEKESHTSGEEVLYLGAESELCRT